MAIPLIRNNAHPRIPDCLEQIIYKKINGISLRCFEKLAHWFLIVFSCFYPAYSDFYRLQSPAAGLLERFPDKEQRVHHYDSDGTRIFDLTAQKIVSMSVYGRGLLELYLDGREVLFSPEPFANYSTQKDVDILYITIKDDVGHPGQVKITEHKTEGRAIHRIVDTNKKFSTLRGVVTCIPPYQNFYNRPVFVVEDVIPRMEGRLEREQ